MNLLEIETPIGIMYAVGDETALYHLDFRKKTIEAVAKLHAGRKSMILNQNQEERLCLSDDLTNAYPNWVGEENRLDSDLKGRFYTAKSFAIGSIEAKIGKNPILESIEKELSLYFEGKLKKFQTPIIQKGTLFQKEVWNALSTISYGTTISYLELATRAGRPRAYRAAGSANGLNQLAIIVPCHRVIAQDGTIGGYASGIGRKKWLLDHEKQFCMYSRLNHE